MRKLKDNELERISGGVTALTVVGITSAVLFVCGIIKGIVYPEACKE